MSSPVRGSLPRPQAVESLQGLIRKARDAGYGVTLFIVAAGEDGCLLDGSGNGGRTCWFRGRRFRAPGRVFYDKP